MGAPEPPEKKPDLFHPDALERVVGPSPPRDRPPDPPGSRRIKVVGPSGSHELLLPGPFDFPPASAEEAERRRRLVLGPTYVALTTPPSDRPSTPADQFEAAGALALVPAALLGATARPAVEWLYGLIDRIPEAIRRPFEKAFGLLVDTALSAASSAAMPLTGVGVERFHPEGLPRSASAKLSGLSQIDMSCGETAVAMILKAAGEPVPLAGVDTQLPGYGGGNLLEDQELRRRGLTVASGPADMDRLRAFVAEGHPVMVSVGWDATSGHFAVVTGYDDERRVVTLANWDAHGTTREVSYDRFAEVWGRRYNWMSAVMPRRDRRLAELDATADLRRPARVYEGLSLSDFWVTEEGKVFVEAAFRHVTAHTDVIVRVHFNGSESDLSRQLGGSLAFRQKLSRGWSVGFQIDKLSLESKPDDWSSFRAAPISIYGSLEGPGFELRAGGERGGFQMSLASDLGGLLAGLGVRVNVAVDEDRSWRVVGTISGTW